MEANRRKKLKPLDKNMNKIQSKRKILAKGKANQSFLPLEKEESEQYPASHFKRAAILPIRKKGEK